MERVEFDESRIIQKAAVEANQEKTPPLDEAGFKKCKFWIRLW
jgi:hypothetical protein